VIGNNSDVPEIPLAAARLAVRLKQAIPQPIKDYIITLRRRYRPRKTIRHHYLGEELKILVVDDVTEGWYGRDWVPEERQEFLFFRDLGISASGLAFNIGAHQGIIALLLKRKLVPQGRVVAIELDKLNADACNENFRLNGEANIIAVHAAISDHCGVVRATGRSNAEIVVRRSMFSALYRNVNSITIDWMSSKYGIPDFIYLDVEGAEVLAMRGATQTINWVPTWLIELHGNAICARFGGSNFDVARQFADAGFTLYASEAEDQPFVQLDDLDHLSSGRCHLFACRELTHKSAI
jgi:FkbM family methyltransferase